VKSLNSIQELHWILAGLSIGEVSGIPGVEVKFVDIWRNNRGESGLLDYY
jgi:hypothetical protein